MDLTETGNTDPSTHWYYRAKRDVVATTVERHRAYIAELRDVGAGDGWFATELAHRWGATATCVDPGYDADLRIDGPVRYVRTLAPTPVELTLFMDVLEHVDDPADLLGHYTRNLDLGDLVLATVPAFASLWGPHDEFLGHRRRYRLGELTALLEGAGLEVLEARYLFGTLYPLAWVKRHLPQRGAPSSDVGPVPAPLNALLHAVSRAEHRWVYQQRLGISALALASVPHGRKR